MHVNYKKPYMIAIISYITCIICILIPLSQLPKLLSQLDQLNICPGHPDEHFVSMVKNKKGIVLNSAGDVAAYIDEVCYDKQKLSEKTIDVHNAHHTDKIFDLYIMGGLNKKLYLHLRL